MKSPTQITLYRHGRTMFDHLTLYLLFPSIKIDEELDYDTPQRGVIGASIDLPTRLHWEFTKNHWTVSMRILGFGLTLTRQSGY